MTTRWRMAMLLVLAPALLGLGCLLPSTAALEATAQGLVARATNALGSVEGLGTAWGTVEAQATNFLGTAMVGAQATLSSMLTEQAAMGTPPPPSAEPATASISGEILTTTPDRPPLRLFARDVVLGRVYSVEVAQGQPTFTIDQLPAGTYVVVAWYAPQGVAGGYTSDLTLAAASVEEQDACGHALVLITLGAGQAFSGADIRCWGANFFTWITPAP
ncbi:MAG: hypothetical protein A2Z30_08005 [Chloroflexi bacterium RBG_16_64_43]|nr:MAG: hypothetical protein A2Z30_08005 [Chloroflexi bacterium RBG_16_64_43]